MTEPILELEFDKYLRERDEAREQVQKVTQELEKYKDEREKDKELIAILQQQLTELQKNET